MTLLILYVSAVVLGPALLVAFLWWAHLRFWQRRLELPHDYAHVETLTMPDGGVIELRRIGAPVDAPAQGHEAPVLMVHGLAMNHRNHDTAQEASFARYLHARGRDVWLLTLRSGRAGWSVFGPRHSSFTPMVEHDLPRAVEAVLRHTQKSQVDVAVFSMGGMLLYASLGRTLNPALVRHAAVFASPAMIRPLGLLNLSRVIPSALNPTVPMRLWTRSLAFAPRWVSALVWGRLYNPRNVDRKIERQMLWNVWEDIPGRLGSEFVGWSSKGGHLTVRGAPVLDGLAQVAVPVCFFAGAVDWLAPVWTVRAGYEAWGRAVPNCNKHFYVLGRENGTQHDYGHCDIAFGLNAQEEVFAPAAFFLATGVFREGLAVSSFPAAPGEASAETVSAA